APSCSLMLRTRFTRQEWGSMPPDLGRPPMFLHAPSCSARDSHVKSEGAWAPATIPGFHAPHAPRAPHENLTSRTVEHGRRGGDRAYGGWMIGGEVAPGPAPAAAARRTSSYTV